MPVPGGVDLLADLPKMSSRMFRCAHHRGLFASHKTKEKVAESKHANIKSTLHDFYSEIQLMSSSGASVGVSAIATTGVYIIFQHISVDKMDLNKIHAVVLNVENEVNTDDIPQDIQMWEMNYKVTTSCAQDLTIPTTSTNTDELINVLKTLYDRKWRYVLISVGKLGRCVMTLFVLGSKTFLFEPYRWIPTTHTLHASNCCSTPPHFVLCMSSV